MKNRLMELVEQAGQKAQEMAQNPQAVQEKAQEKAQEAKPQASRGAWITFGALILSLGAAVGGAMAGRRRTPRERST